MSDLTDLQKEILEYCRSNGFHKTVEDCVGISGRFAEEVNEAMIDLKRRRVISVAPGNRSFIGATNYGWKLMNWT